MSSASKARHKRGRRRVLPQWWERSSWLALKRAEAAALPAPVRRLLIDLRDDCPITAAAPAGRQ